MSFTGNDIKADVQAILVDSGIRWSDANLLTWANEGGRDIASNKPKATTVRQSIQLTANTVRQPNPSGVIQVLDLLANMGATGTTPGRAISLVTEDRLNAARPSWRSDKGAVVKHLIQDDRDPGFFRTWPAPATALYVEALVQKAFAPITALSDVLPLDDSYRNPLAAYVLSCAFAMEGDNQNANAAAGYYQKYASALGIQIQRQKRASAPANGPESPAYPVVDKNGA